MFRCYDDDGCMREDILSLEGDNVDGEALIRPMMKDGRRLSAAEPLERSRQRALGEFKRLPETLKRLEQGIEYPVTVSEALKKLAHEVDTIQARSTAQPEQRIQSTTDQPGVC